MRTAQAVRNALSDRSINRIGRCWPDAIAWTEYDQWPRGRIVYETTLHRFVLYADRRLQKPDIVGALKSDTLATAAPFPWF